MATNFILGTTYQILSRANLYKYKPTFNSFNIDLSFESNIFEPIIEPNWF